MTPERAAACAMADLRQQHGWTQVDLARLMCDAGMRWTANRVAQVETLRGTVKLGEAVALAQIFGTTVERLVHHEPPTADGQPQPDAAFPLAFEADQSRRAAKRAGLTRDELNHRCQQRFGRSFIAERAARWEAAPDGPKRSVQTWRGHVTRGLLDELRHPADQPEEEPRTS